MGLRQIAADIDSLVGTARRSGSRG